MMIMIFISSVIIMYFRLVVKKLLKPSGSEPFEYLYINTPVSAYTYHTHLEHCILQIKDQCELYNGY